MHDPQTLTAAWDVVDLYEHNYKAIVGWEAEAMAKGRAHMVTWAPEEEAHVAALGPAWKALGVN